MVMQKLEGEKLKRVKAGVDGFCCWDGGGCDCTPESVSFAQESGGWLDNMEILEALS